MRTFASRPASGMFFSFSPLGVNPGAIAFTRMPKSPSSRASERVNPTTPPLEVV